MIDKPDSSHTLGLELEATELRIAEISLFKGKPKLETLLKAQIENGPDSFHDVKPLYIAKKEGDIHFDQTLKRLLHQNLSVTCLNHQQLITRSLEIKLKKEKDINAVLPFQVESIIPFPYETSIVDKIKIERTADGTELTVFAAKKDHVKKHLDTWKSLKIEPEIISSESLALASFSNHFYPSKNPFFIIYFSSSYITCSYIKNGLLIASQSCCFKDSEELNLNEILRMIYAASKQMKGIEIQELLFLGNTSNNETLIAKLLEKTHKTRALLQKDTAFDISDNELASFAVPIGLALSVLPKQTSRVNFRQLEFVYPDPWKHLKKPLITYLFLGALASFAFYFFSNAYLNHFEDEIKQEYVALLSSMNKPYQAFENEYFAKFPLESNEYHEIPSITTLSQEDINNRLKFLYTELQASPDTFPLFPNVPRVSDVLAWLSNHPNIVEKNVDSDKINLLIQLENFSYSMLKRPEQTKKQEKYQVKVEFEFTTATPKLAREFHDALIAPNEIVDPKGEIKWSANRGRYKTSFFLKDKTIYPGTR